MTNYRRGYDAEMRCVEAWREHGYESVRTAGSHSPWDVLAVNAEETWLIQVKRTKEAPTDGEFSKELNILKKIATGVGTFQALWWWVDRVGWRVQCVQWPSGEQSV
jgi:Holliday junction resolvase